MNFREEVKLNKILYDDGNETDSSEEEAQWEAASKGIYEHTMAKRRAKAAAFNRPAQDLIEPLIPDEHPDFKMVTEFPKTAEEMIDGLLSLGQAMQDPLEVSAPHHLLKRGKKEYLPPPPARPLEPTVFNVSRTAGVY